MKPKALRLTSSGVILAAGSSSSNAWSIFFFRPSLPSARHGMFAGQAAVFLGVADQVFHFPTQFGRQRFYVLRQRGRFVRFGKNRRAGNQEQQYKWPEGSRRVQKHREGLQQKRKRQAHAA